MDSASGQENQIIIFLGFLVSMRRVNRSAAQRFEETVKILDAFPKVGNLAYWFDVLASEAEARDCQDTLPFFLLIFFSTFIPYFFSPLSLIYSFSFSGAGRRAPNIIERRAEYVSR